MHRSESNDRAGVSLVEVLSVTAIVGVIAAIIVPVVGASRDREDEQVHARNIETINSAVERWYIEKGVWPESLSELESNPDYFPTSAPRNPVTGNPYRLNAQHRAEDAESIADRGLRIAD